MIDIPTALTIVSQATGIVKNIREIDKSFDLAGLKAQMADLYGKLADVKIALSDARETIHDRELKIKELEKRIADFNSGEQCPICNEGRLKIAASVAHPAFGFAGVQQRTVKCDKCNHAEKRIHDPEGRMKG